MKNYLTPGSFFEENKQIKVEEFGDALTLSRFQFTTKKEYFGEVLLSHQLASDARVPVRLGCGHNRSEPLLMFCLVDHVSLGRQQGQLRSAVLGHRDCQI